MTLNKCETTDHIMVYIKLRNICQNSIYTRDYCLNKNEINIMR